MSDKNIPTQTRKCAYKGCRRLATTLACGTSAGSRVESSDEGRHPTPAWYCAEHAQEVADEGYPEYIVDCPCCGCLLGV